MEKVINSIKNKPVNGYVIAVTAVLYCLNRFYLKSHTSGWINYLLRCHFNDFLCGSLFTAYSNVFLNTRKVMLNKLPHILAYCFFAGLVWEFVAPYVRKDAVSDWIDVLCYVLGGLAYWSVLCISFKTAKRE